jgi:hypothetical protein
VAVVNAVKCFLCIPEHKNKRTDCTTSGVSVRAEKPSTHLKVIADVSPNMPCMIVPDRQIGRSHAEGDFYIHGTRKKKTKSTMEKTILPGAEETNELTFLGAENTFP